MAVADVSCCSSEPISTRERLIDMQHLLRPALLALLVLTVLPGASAASDTDSTPGAGARADPVYVNSTEILYLESFPVQLDLLVEGSLPTPCHEPMWEIDDTGSSVDVRLWSEAPPEAACIAILEPVELRIPLGSYETANVAVSLNGDPVGRIGVGQGGADEPDLLGAGWSFGMCLGYCGADLEVKDDRLSMSGWDREASQPLYANAGMLTPAGRERLAAALEGVDVGSLEATYGCPDCADGGAAYILLGAGDTPSRHDMEFGRPPPELTEVCELTAAMMSALEACRSDELVTVDDDCEAYQRR